MKHEKKKQIEKDSYHVNILDSWSQQENKEEKWDR